jgi:hypothetical protein
MTGKSGSTGAAESEREFTALGFRLESMLAETLQRGAKSRAI